MLPAAMPLVTKKTSVATEPYRITVSLGTKRWRDKTDAISTQNCLGVFLKCGTLVSHAWLVYTSSCERDQETSKH